MSVHFLSLQMDLNIAKDEALYTDVANLNTSSTSGQQVNSNTAAKQESL